MVHTFEKTKPNKFFVKIKADGKIETCVVDAEDSRNAQKEATERKDTSYDKN